MGVCTGSGISERSIGPGYGRCDDKVAIHSRRVLLASRGAKVWGTEAGVAAAKENTRMRFTKAGLGEIRAGGTIREFVHSWADPPRRR